MQFSSYLVAVLRGYVRGWRGFIKGVRPYGVFEGIMEYGVFERRNVFEGKYGGKITK